MSIDLTSYKIEVGDRPTVYQSTQPSFIEDVEVELNRLYTASRSIIYDPPNDGRPYGRRVSIGNTVGSWVPIDISGAP